ncbi:AT-rich interactive domain-containing protein 5A [Dunckerocampus dactyliophorus]|uniref:AT-rich interactive domain-containing protein 5A n=1 Tax=Dunckerocampus dactyliophorus TaxID=161453 RepID=UPI0024072E00|nr:AT-rich interactive domain-containing protein 5A [Dunckerocampus dactyliophorus]
MDHEDQSVTVVSEEEEEEEEEEEDKRTANKTSPAIEVNDKCKKGQGSGLLQMEEKSFVSSLHSFMKERGSPIERIPHLGFKQINLWMIYKTVEKLGGYNSVTARRLWKKVYDELGGSPGSTSAATCTRRHYERLVLPFERHLRGEDDKPLPLSKPRKPYKRKGKMNKAEWEGKRIHADRGKDCERIPEAASQSGAVMPPHQSTLWPERHHLDCSQPDRPLTPDLYTCSHLVHGSAATPWPANLSSVAGEVISPLEKKKRVAQASLQVKTEGKWRDRPSVIQRSLSPACSSHKCNSSDGSPCPPSSSSSSSSQSTSPCSISSEDAPACGESKPDLALFSTVKNTLNQSEDMPMRQIYKDPAGENKDRLHVSSQKVKAHIKDWKPKGGDINLMHPFYSAIKGKSDCSPPPSSSFVNVLPRSTHIPRPAPIRPGYRSHQATLTHCNASSLKNIPLPPWLYQTEKWETLRAIPAKVPSTQHTLSHTACVLPPYDKSDSHQQTTLHHPAFLPRMRIPQSQLMYRHVPGSATSSALIYPYPYSIPLWGPHTAYTLPTMNTFYTHKL